MLTDKDLLQGKIKRHDCQAVATASDVIKMMRGVLTSIENELEWRRERNIAAGKAAIGAPELALIMHTMTTGMYNVTGDLYRGFMAVAEAAEARIAVAEIDAAAPVAQASPAGPKSADSRHAKDSDCTVGADGCCTICGVSHAQPCGICGGAGFHKDGCAGLDADPVEVA